MLDTFVRGVAVGFSIAAPVGPIGLLCIRRSASEGRAVGLATGLGAAAADACYGAVAAFGLTAVSGALTAWRRELALTGGLFLLYLGVSTALSRPAARAAAPKGRGGLPGAFGSTFLLTLANPTTIVSFAAVFAALGLGAESGPGDAAALVAGVFAGSAAWWLLLSGGVAALRGRLDERRLAWVNRASGALLCAFALAALWSAAR
jgi:threonine/homoserine/homoserine lactone efflux protein